MVLRKKGEKSAFASPLNNAYGPIGCEYIIGIFQETGLAYFSYKSKIRFNIKRGKIAPLVPYILQPSVNLQNDVF